MTLWFSIPRRVARVVDFPGVARMAREGGVVQPSIAHSTRRLGVDWTRVTCSAETAAYLVHALQRIVAGAERFGHRELHDAALSAVATALNEIERRGDEAAPTNAVQSGCATNKS